MGPACGLPGDGGLTGALLMPSYRVAFDVHGVLPGVAPESLLPRAEELLAVGHLVEDRSVEIVRGQPQIHLRFLVASADTAEQDEEAVDAVRGMVTALAPIARLGRWTVRRGPGRHWRTIRTGDSRVENREYPVDF